MKDINIRISENTWWSFYSLLFHQIFTKPITFCLIPDNICNNHHFRFTCSSCDSMSETTFKDSTSTSERILPVKSVIKSLGLLCKPYFIFFFSKIKTSSFLLCRFLILFIRFSISRLIEYLISCTFNHVVELVKLDDLIVRHLFRSFLSYNLSFIASNNKRR